jgi:hypothetical protein
MFDDLEASHGARRHFIDKKVFICGRAFSLDHRGWKAAPTEKDLTHFEEI